MFVYSKGILLIYYLVANFSKMEANYDVFP